MKTQYKQLAEAVDNRATWMQFQPKQCGFECFAISAYCQWGTDLLLPLQYATKEEAADVCRALTFAYQQGQRMQCRNVIDKVTYRAKFSDGRP